MKKLGLKTRSGQTPQMRGELQRIFRNHGYSDMTVRVAPLGMDNYVSVFFVSERFRGKNWTDRYQAVKTVLGSDLKPSLLRRISHYLVMTPDEFNMPRVRRRRSAR